MECNKYIYHWVLCKKWFFIIKNEYKISKIYFKYFSFIITVIKKKYTIRKKSYYK